MERNPFKRITRWFQPTTPTSTAIVSQPSPEELERQEEEKKRRKREEIRQWISTLSPILIVIFSTIPLAIIGSIISNIDKLESYFAPEEFSCEKVSFKISKNWQAQGCHPVAYKPDAQIVRKSSQDPQPKILLIVEDVIDLDFDLRDFYDKQKEEAQVLIEEKVYPDFEFQDHNAFQLIYHNAEVKRLDIGFLYGEKAYIIRYEAMVEDFDRYEKEAQKIINSLKFDQENKM